jgi:Holliday junction resolvase
VSNYDRGVRLERDTRHDLEANGYEVIRSAGSKSAIDLVAFKPGELLFVQCKAASGVVSPAERARLVAAASTVQALPVVALRPLRKPITYRVLYGMGPKEWSPWTPDRLA